MIEPEELSAYLASRVCHDLVSPVSSINTSLEFIDDPRESDMHERANSLLRKGAADASDRLQFLRYAFGTMGLSDGAADIHQAKHLTEKFVATHKPSVEWDIETDHLSFSHVRLMMNLVMLGMESLPRGGVIHVRVRNEANGMMISATAKGVRASIKGDTKTALEGGVPEEGWSAQTVQPLFALMLAKGLGGSIGVSTGEEVAVYTAHGIRAEG
ncbi:MAG: histidine phosphotransferase family protein [Pseudomonadota bacterium]